jgi:hypothetical protein
MEMQRALRRGALRRRELRRREERRREERRREPQRVTAPSKESAFSHRQCGGAAGAVSAVTCIKPLLSALPKCIQALSSIAASYI